MFVIFDLDGTLADVEHRRHFISGPRGDWARFFAACVDDPPITPIIETLKLFRSVGHRVEIWSGRSDEVRAQTDAWLSHHVGEGVTATRMRQAGDHQPDDELKQSWLLSEATPPDLIFDDRDKVVAMWRRNGIRCAQVAPGDF